VQLEAALKQIAELIYREAGLTDDGRQGASLEIASGMYRDRHGPARVAGMNENMVASGNPINEKPRSLQCADNVPATDDWQGAAAHG
jgi:hypothetical protein